VVWFTSSTFCCSANLAAGVITRVSGVLPLANALLSMGFDQVFHIVDEPFKDEASFHEWVADSVCENEAREQVIAAHRVLMSLNEKNKNTFKELVDSLESDRSHS